MNTNDFENLRFAVPLKQEREEERNKEVYYKFITCGGFVGKGGEWVFKKQKPLTAGMGDGVL